MGPSPTQGSAVERLRSLVFGDAALQAELAPIFDPAHMAEVIIAAAAAQGLAVSRDEILALTAPDPLGVARWLPARANATEWPSAAWLPAAVEMLHSPSKVTWLHFADERLTMPFFEESLRNAFGKPFNRAFPYRTTLDDFVARARLGEALAPSGFIFHMSRCGSTLVAQMLASVPRNIVVSEAPPLDAVMQIAARSSVDPIPAVRAMVAALGRPRFGERHYVLKLDCWHTLALPLFRAAFPSVPWIFLYRDPVEVMVSQMRAPGMHMAPGALPEHLYGIDGGRTMAREDYCARVLEKTCAAVLDNWSRGGGLVVNYSELPDAVWSKILPHFGIAESDDDHVEMGRATRQNAKAPHETFAGDSASKQREATPQIRDAADRHLAEIYRRLEARRAA